MKQNISRREFLKLTSYGVLDSTIRSSRPLRALAHSLEDPFDSTEHLTDVIKEHARPLNFWEISASRPGAHLMVGEWHSDDSSRVQVRKGIPRLNLYGFNTMFMEVFDTESAPIIKEYQRTGGANRQQLEDFCFARGILQWSKRDFLHSSELLKRIGQYERVLNKATHAGIRVIPIDMPKAKQYEQSFNVESERNKWMAAPIHHEISQPSSSPVRGLIHVGKWHLDSQNPADVARLAGITNVITADLSGALEIKDAAARAGRGNDLFMIPNRIKFPGSSNPADWIVYNPQTLVEAYDAPR